MATFAALKNKFVQVHQTQHKGVELLPLTIWLVSFFFLNLYYRIILFEIQIVLGNSASLSLVFINYHLPPLWSDVAVNLIEISISVFLEKLISSYLHDKVSHNHFWLHKSSFKHTWTFDFCGELNKIIWKLITCI